MSITLSPVRLFSLIRLFMVFLVFFLLFKYVPGYGKVCCGQGCETPHPIKKELKEKHSIKILICIFVPWADSSLNLWVPKWGTFVLTSGDWVWDWQASCIWEQGDVIISIFSSFSKVSSTPRSNEMLAVKIYSVGFLFVLAARGSFQSKFFRHRVICNFSC